MATKIQMVEFKRRKEEGKSITEQTSERLKLLHEKIQAAQEVAQDKQDIDIRSPTVYVFGSWARGTALAGVSDLDMVLLYSTTQFKDFQQNQIWLSSQTNEILKSNQPGWANNLFDGYDIFAIAGRNANVKLNDKFTESRDERPEGKRRIYNLTGQFYRREAF